MSTFTVGAGGARSSRWSRVYLGFTKSIPFRATSRSGGVQDANNLAKASPVRIAGVNVGKVVEVEHTAPGDDSAIVTMRIDRRAARSTRTRASRSARASSSRATSSSTSRPGTPSAPELGDGDVIPINQTATPVQLDQMLAALQSDTREDLKMLLREYSAALEGEGADGFNDSLKYWKGAYRDGALVAEASLGQAEHDLSEYIDRAGVVADALDRSPEQLKALITDFNTTAAAFAREDANLEAAVAELPRTLRAAQPALAALNRAFPALRALARDLRPGVASSGPAIDARCRSSSSCAGSSREPELRGLTADLRPTVPSLARSPT